MASKKLCEMVGDRSSKIKTNHAWMGPKRGGDTRVYTALRPANNLTCKNLMSKQSLKIKLVPGDDWYMDGDSIMLS